MEDLGTGGGGESLGGRVTSQVVGGRQRFTVELRPGETTIVSWKKLVKDKPAIANGPPSQPLVQSGRVPPPPAAHPALDSRVTPPVPAGENEGVNGPPASRYSAVIEKIERLYVGKDSSDEEDLNDVPDDDEYDTEDSFIDDTELDEYFQVDNSAIKHDGFFVNRGKLERIETTQAPNEQPKKRRRKDVTKTDGRKDDEHNPNKHTKIGKKVGKSVQLDGRSSFQQSGSAAMPNIHYEELRLQNQMGASENSLKRKSTDAKTILDLNLSEVPNGDGMVQNKEMDNHKTGVLPTKNHGNNLKEGDGLSDISNLRSNEKSVVPGKPYSEKPFNNIGEYGPSVQRREKGEKSDVYIHEGKSSMQSAVQKAPFVQRKDGSYVRPKSTMLEKAIRELEKMVAECRPPALEFHDADSSSQNIKRRLPPEVKQKLAKVARLAQASHGKITKELVNRLMSIVGHLIQIRTLKRNLKIMVNMGLTAKQEKDDRVQNMKKEVAEMIKTRIPFMKSKAIDQQAGTSDDFQETGADEKEALKRKYSMDDALEDKICDLYDLFIEGLEEDAGPQARKLYAELAVLWPNGFMDNHGIKRAICRAKDRRRALYSRRKDQEKIRRKKLASKTEDFARGEISAQAQPLNVQEKLVADQSDHQQTSVNKPASSISSTNAAVRAPLLPPNVPIMERPKQEKMKGISTNLGDTRVVDELPKKKIKRKPEVDLREAQNRPEKLSNVQAEERHKSQKQVSATKSNLQPSAASSIEPLS